MTTSALTILAMPLVLLAAVFLLAGELIRRRMHAADASPHRLLNDLRGLEHALVDFFASSKVSSGILSVLAARRKPVGFQALAEEVRTGVAREHRDEMPLPAMRAVLSILQFARLVRMRASRFSITDLGREVYRRMQPDAVAPSPSQTIGIASPKKPSRSRPAVLSSHSHRVLSELRERARTLVQQ